MNRDVAYEHLTHVGLRTLTAENGKIAVEMVQERIYNREKPFDLILMDIFMPVMDGIEAAEKITALGTGTPIVAMTANVMTGEIEKYKNHGMPDCLGKPFTTKELLSVLQKHLRQTSSADDTPADTGTKRMPEYEDITGGKNYGAYKTDPYGNTWDGMGVRDTYMLCDDDIANEILNSFLRNNRTKITEISEALESGDIPAAHRLVHDLKGNAGMIGKPALQKAAADLEPELLNIIDTDSENRSIPADLISALKTELERVFEDAH